MKNQQVVLMQMLQGKARLRSQALSELQIANKYLNKLTKKSEKLNIEVSIEQKSIN